MRGVITSFVIALAFVSSICVAVEQEHEMCCNSCVSKYGASGNLATACLRGCRLYGMIFLAHDRSVERAEIAGLCAKSCAAAPDASAACAVGCAQQERVFRERQVGRHSAKLAVMFGLPSAPEVHSPAPFHGRLFNRMPLQQQQRPLHAWLHAVQVRIRPLSAGPDGRPRYWVEVSEHEIPLQLALQPHATMPQPHQYWRQPAADLPLMSRMPHLSHRARVGIRWAACALLVMSLVGLAWLCCSVFRIAPRTRVVQLPGLLRKQPPTSVQSGDIWVSSTSDSCCDKKPLLLAQSEDEKVGKLEVA